jgi:hypothetical protein
MPLARGVRVRVVHIFCSASGLASQPLRMKANQRDEAVDAESQEGYHDDVHPPHVDHRNLTIYLTFPEQKAAHRVVDHTRSNEVACRSLTQLGHLAANCLRSRDPDRQARLDRAIQGTRALPAWRVLTGGRHHCRLLITGRDDTVLFSRTV